MSESEIEIKEEKENKLLNRRELVLIVSHGKNPIPSRDDFRNRISNFMGVSKDQVIINKINSEFGMDSTQVFTKVYNSKDDVLKYESEYSKNRNKIQG
ncbi:MAG: hypothetical protein ACOC1V_03040 [Candidatus Saliniplasma sp.]